MLSLEPFKKRRWLTCAISPHKAPSGGQGPRHFAWLSGALFLGIALLAWPFSVDDAFISARYAVRISLGKGYTFSDGPPTDGVTGPLWLLPLWLFAHAGLDTLVAAKLSGALATAFCVARVVGRARAQAQGRWTAPLTFALCTSSIPLTIWSVGGLETGLATLCATELALAVTKPRVGLDVGPGAWVGVLSGLCAWLRPELAFWVFSLLLYFSTRELRTGLIAWSVAGLFGLGLVGFRLFMFGHALPMTAAAKPTDIFFGVAYLRRALLRPDAVCLAVCLLWAFWVVRRRQALRHSRAVEAPRISQTDALLAATASHAFAIVLAGGDWMPGFRLFAPALPAFFLAFARLMTGPLMRRRTLTFCALSVLLVLRTVALVPELVRAREMGSLQARARAFYTEALQDIRGPVVALDVGLLGDVYSGPIVDLGGLTEPRIAYARGGHLDKQLDSAWLKSQHPALIVLHSSAPPQVDARGYIRWFQGYPVERRVLAMPWVMQNYEVSRVQKYADNYYYVLLTPRASDP